MHDIRSYLLKWKNDHDNWKFQKSKQNWIIRNIYIMEKDLFKIAVKYLGSGSVKSFLIDNAKGMLDKAKVDKDSQDYAKQKLQRKRARKLIKFYNKLL